MIVMRLYGHKEVARRLRQLPDKLQRKLVRKALREGANVFKVAARDNAPKRTGAMAAAIKVVGRRSQRRFFQERMQVRLRITYGSFQEYGAPGRRVPATHFMQRAYRSRRMQVVEKFKAAILSGLASVTKG